MSPAWVWMAWALASPPTAEPAGSTLRGQTIQEVRMEAPEDEDRDRLLRLSQLVPGRAYDPAAVRRAVETLYRLGRFDNVRVFVMPAEPEGLILTLQLPPRPVLAELQVLESGAVPDAWVRQGLGLELGDEVQTADLAELRRRLEERLMRAGWRQPAVGLAMERLDQKGSIRLLVRVDPGPLVRIRRVRFVGDPVWASWELRSRFEVSEEDVLDLDRLQSALDGLEQDYRDAGHYDVEISLDQVVAVQGREPKADLRVRVDAGPRVQVEVVGNERVPKRFLRAETSVLEERGTDRSSLREVQDRMLDALKLRGHHRAAVRVEEETHQGLRTVRFEVREGPVGRIGDLVFDGAQSLPERKLEGVVRETAERTLNRILGQPGVDPRVVARIAGGPASTERRVRAVDSTPPDPTKIYVSRAARAASDALASLYRSEGFQMVQVDPPQVREREDGLLDVIYSIEEGIPWRIQSVSIQGNDSFADRELLELLAEGAGVRAGEPLVFERLEEAIRQLVQRYEREGYLYVKVFDGFTSRREVDEPRAIQARKLCEELGESEACPIEVVFQVVEGPLVTTDRVLVRTDQHTRESVIRSELAIEPDTPLTTPDTELSRERLLRLGVFDRVRVEPADPDRIETRKDVVVQVFERNRYALELGGGLSTEDGGRLFSSLSDNNFLGRAIRLQLDGRLNYWPRAFSIIYSEAIRPEIEEFYVLRTTEECVDVTLGELDAGDPAAEACRRSFFERLEFQVAAGISAPRIFGLPRGFSGGLDLVVLRNLDPAFLETGQEASLRGVYRGFRPRLFGKRRNLALELRTGLERTELECNDDLSEDETQRALLCGGEEGFVPGQQVSLERDTLYFTGGPVVSLDLRNEPLDPTRGIYAEVKTVFAKGLNGEEETVVLDDAVERTVSNPRSPDFARVEGRLNFYLPLAPRVTWASALLGKRVWPLNADQVPVNQRIFAGGRTTIRGYQENTLLPQDVELDPETGDAVGDISAGGLLFVGIKNELRFKLGGAISLVAFHDVGDLFQDGEFSFSTSTSLTATEAEPERTRTRGLAQGAGLGLRLATPVGPLAVDLAHPIQGRDDVGDFQLHFAVGAF